MLNTEVIQLSFESCRPTHDRTKNSTVCKCCKPASELDSDVKARRPLGIKFVLPPVFYFPQEQEKLKKNNPQFPAGISV